MEILNLTLPAPNRFATGYFEGNTLIQDFFHYDYKKENHYAERLKELGTRQFFRNELADHIDEFMSRYPSSDQVRDNLRKLRQKNSVAVIGGQQAGLFTGPLYSLHKVISIIKLAEQKEAELGVPVVPVFWIAGEDHDFQEINHVYVMNTNKPEKRVFPQKQLEKKMASELYLDQEVCRNWVEGIIETYGETEHTKDLLSFTEQQLLKSETIVDFFASVIMEIFKDHGLLIIDSGNSGLRKLEKEYFSRQIKNHEAITASVLHQQKEKEAAGFQKAMDISPNAINLFYYDRINNERILLQSDPEGKLLTGKNGEVSFTEGALLEIASEHPEKLSNNVVTRPLMQEWLFPVLAFIGGPGEIAYWSELKLVFEHFGMKMPPLVPRLNITLLDRSIERDIEELGLDLSEVLTAGTEKFELRYIDSIKDRELEVLFEKTKEQLEENYRMIRTRMSSSYPALLSLLEKNEDVLLGQIDFMEKKTEESACRKNDAVLRKFSKINHALRPLGIPQERVWNPFWYFNRYGMDFVSELIAQNLTFDGTHKVVKM
ncbi:bacillithiol biosynthesis cysteine-adding enzyme BshC [Mesobacillus zeae]|uniref:Putative cysteine ligase BshC n=1 Tax=Mesobacillus zeae TaxID=1917180 RepID=A0A398BF61_9BACI|nr:bacillithiol biosynthesis cysteine-adding enzyme BshC [Mesobacillus zeae]RID87901.1 bacillithiol biosynthesis cysteine-adding enzyme BshC [Mesobacillus zeae]